MLSVRKNVWQHGIEHIVIVLCVSRRSTGKQRTKNLRSRSSRRHTRPGRRCARERVTKSYPRKSWSSNFPCNSSNISGHRRTDPSTICTIVGKTESVFLSLACSTFTRQSHNQRRAETNVMVVTPLYLRERLHTKC